MRKSKTALQADLDHCLGDLTPTIEIQKKLPSDASVKKIKKFFTDQGLNKIVDGHVHSYDRKLYWMINHTPDSIVPDYYQHFEVGSHNEWYKLFGLTAKYLTFTNPYQKDLIRSNRHLLSLAKEYDNVFPGVMVISKMVYGLKDAKAIKLHPSSYGQIKTADEFIDEQVFAKAGKKGIPVVIHLPTDGVDKTVVDKINYLSLKYKTNVVISHMG